MEPKIIKGHLYKCKENVGKDYTKGHVYECEHENPNAKESGDCACGYITNNQGNTGHAWPYNPENHPWTKDDPQRNRWTAYFQDLGEKPHGIILCPYEIGDSVKWYCDDDAKVHTSKIRGIRIDIDQSGKPVFTFDTVIRHKGQAAQATFGLYEIRATQN